MRRPLFGNGIPRNVVVADGEVTILDTEDLDQSQVFALTVFFWPYQPGPGPFTNPAAAIRTYINGGPSVPIVGLTSAYLNSFFSAANPTRIEPIKVLDRFMMRGKQRVTIQVTVDGTPTPVGFIWGYFELAGEQDTGVPFRGFQPTGKPATNFAYNPVFLALGTSENGQGTCHKLDPNYIDLVTLDLVHGGSGDGTFGWSVAVGLPPGNVLIPQPSLSNLFPAPANGLYRYRIFDGIPMRALGSSDADSNIFLIGGVGPAPSINLVATAYGSFVRT